jgi:3-hydroxyisobutyrate dehydrogenase-like beta-hydroxyacid dehydrogenase
MPQTGSIIGFIGAGRIGGPMVERLLQAGHAVRLFARRDEVRARFTQLGAQVVEDAAQAGVDADIVIACVYSDQQLREVATGPRGLIEAMRPGAVLASHVTGTRATVLELAALARARGVAVVDAPFSGTDANVRAGTLTVLLGGSDQDTQRAAAIVSAYAGTTLRIGALGSALQVKLLNNLVFAANIQLLLETVNTARALELPVDTVLQALCSGSAGSYASEALRRAPTPEAFADVVTPFMRKDLAALAATAAELGVDITRLLQAATSGPLDLACTGATA